MGERQAGLSFAWLKNVAFNVMLKWDIGFQMEQTLIVPPNGNNKNFSDCKGHFDVYKMQSSNTENVGIHQRPLLTVGCAQPC